jgi:hypothetical protein
MLSFDDLDQMVHFEFGSQPAFCKATGIPENQLKAFMAGRADLSLSTLLQGLQTIGYRLRITPAAPASKIDNSRSKRNKRTVRSA